jgi:hypothetical protein
MNRHQRQRARAMARAQTRYALPNNHHNGVSVEIADDIKRDIAKVVRSIYWQLAVGMVGGMCFWRCMTGWTTLRARGIPAQPALGGMIYRAGPDERRDVVAFCGQGNAGRHVDGGILAHYFIVSGNNIVDFSVGDWEENSRMLPDIEVPGTEPLGAVCWTAPPLPEFFWADRSNFMPNPSAYTPDLGHAWYTGFADDAAGLLEQLIEDAVASLRMAFPHIARGIEHYALKERLFAVRGGHTAVRFSQLAEMIGDPVLMARARQDERLIVLPGKVDITSEIARETLIEAGFEVAS